MPRLKGVRVYAFHGGTEKYIEYFEESKQFHDAVVVLEEKGIPKSKIHLSPQEARSATCNCIRHAGSKSCVSVITEEMGGVC